MSTSQEASTAAGVGVNPQLPWASIPKFTPGVTNVQEYTQKLKFLAAMWPSDSLELLAPRAALLVEGTAFRKVARLDPSKLKVANLTGIALLVEAIGGSWGSTELEERYEFFEKALYGTVQRPDESHDCYLARMENNFIELLTRNTKLEEVQAYVLLRQSTLSADDKKRILLEHEGELKYKPVVKAFRLLGSRFFNEFQSGRSATKTKVYDVNFTEDSEQPSSSNSLQEGAFAFQAALDEPGEVDLDSEFLEAMIASEDQDALLISDFEGELEDFLQGVPGMCEAMTSYVEARAKLLEKRKSRGFWPVKGGKSKSFKGRGRGKGKSAKDRENLLARIAKSRCRLCDQVGHWKAECPNRSQSSDANKSASVNLAQTPPPSFEPVAEPLEVISEPEDEDSQAMCRNVDCNVCRHPNQLSSIKVDQCEDAFVVRELFDNSHRFVLQNRVKKFVLSSSNPSSKCPHDVYRNDGSRTPRDVPALRMFRQWKEDLPRECLTAICDQPCHAILDTGASRCIIGENVLKEFRRHLPAALNSQIREMESQVKFRFGNNQSLTSSYRVQIPLLKADNSPRKLWLAIEVVPGHTPFLFSKKAFKQLGGILDTNKDQCILSRLNRVFPLQLSRTDLYLIDVSKLCSPPSSEADVYLSNHAGKVEVSWGYKDTQALGNHDKKIPMSFPDCFSAKDQCSIRQPPLSSLRVSPELSERSNRDHASQSDVGQSQERVRIAPRHSHTAASGVGSPDRDSTPCRGRSGTWRTTSQHRDGPDHGQHVARTAESEVGFTKPGCFTDQLDCSQNIETCHVSSCSDQRQSDNATCQNEPEQPAVTNDESSDATTGRSRFFSWSSQPRGYCGLLGACRRGRSPERRDDRASYDQCDESSCDLISYAGITNSGSDKSAQDCGRLGTMPSDLGQKAQGQDLPGGLSDRPRVLPLEPCPIPESAREPEGLRKILPSPCRDGFPQSESRVSVATSFACMSPKIDNDKSFLMFKKEVNRTRHQLSVKGRTPMFDHSVNQAFKTAEETLEHAFQPALQSTTREPVLLLEVYAGTHSPLVEAVQKLGHKAVRFSRMDGDLSTPEGRRKLWQVVDECQPEHIWVAPECGPWSGWSHLNQQKSLELFDKITKDQANQLQHIRLCAQLCRYQVSRKRHFHLEQPLGSSMSKTDEFQSILTQTDCAVFDMCRFGLKIPGTQRFLKKRSKVFTTCSVVVTDLHGEKCPQDHEHQLIEGQAWIQGRRQLVTQFCATYCSGFVHRVAKCLVKSAHEAFVNEPDDDENPPKRFRFTRNPSKRIKTHHETDGNLEDEPSMESQLPASASDPNPAEPLPVDVSTKDRKPDPLSEQWRDAFRLAQQVAPRVGNLEIESESSLFGIVQSLIPDLTVHRVFICRGTERFQVPTAVLPGNQYPIRHTVCLHRFTDKIHDFGSENWCDLRRQFRIRASLPSKITITSFGVESHKPESHDKEHVPEIPRDAADLPIVNEPSHESVLRKRFGNSEVCEGWAPPPVPIHGPAFRDLTSHEKQDLVKLHKNLGHPDPKVLADHLTAQKALPHIIEAAKDFVCDACVESTGRRHQRPAKLHEPREFNQCVGLDGFFWRGKAGFQVHVLHCIDEASLFHLGRRIPTRHPDQVISTFCDFWSSWAGNPKTIYADPAGEFRSQTWKDFLQSKNISFGLTTEAWQRGRIERHGGIIKEMLSRCDQELSITTIEEFDQVLTSCFQAKNALSRHQGYAPEQIVLGKSTDVPASLTSDEQSGAHTFALGDSLESERFRKHLEVRSLARRTFLLVDNDHAMRRALLRKSCPARGPFEVGHQVMYWLRNPKLGRLSSGRWHGPAKVLCIESPSAIWISHVDRVFKCAPESLRSASLREWQHAPIGRERVPESLNGPTPDEDRPSVTPVPDGIPPLEPFGDTTLETIDQEYSPTTPGQPNTPNSSSLQPEVEATPAIDVPVPDTPIVSPALEPSNPVGLSGPIDLDPLEEPANPVLACHEIFLSSECMEDALLQIDTLQTGSSESQVLLAEDHLPILDEPLSCTEEQCFVLEVPMSECDIHRWFQAEKPEECAHVATAGRRARSEVQVKNLCLEDRILFEKAKDAELNCWLQTNALRPILRRFLNPEQILKSRWVLTWKPIDDAPSNGPQKKAKARLVVLGFQDPRLTEVVRDSPTLTREGRHTILQAIASFKWVLTSFDIKTAFLRGKADDSNPLAMEPPVELRRKLQLTDHQVCALVGNAYGRVDAPLLFYKELSRQLKNLGFSIHPLEPCVFYLETCIDGKRTFHGIVGTHVDDGVGGGDEYFHQQIEKLREKLPFGSFKQKKFVFTGIQLDQLPDFSVMCSQADYIRQIPGIDIGRPRRQVPDAPINDNELSKLRGLIGSLQYAVTNTRPDMAAKLGEVQTQIAKAKISTLILANKVLREAQVEEEVKICFRSIPHNKLTHVSFGDASFASPKQLDSFQGTLICATDDLLNKNESAPISPLTWSSKKIARVVRSTLSAEAFAMSKSVDKLGWMRLLWGVLSITNFNWREAPVAFKQLPMATIATDCKSLYDLVTRNAIPSCEEYRTTLEVLLIRERCQEHCQFRWIPTHLQLADPLTKPMDASLLRWVLSSGTFQLFDEEATLQQNAQRKEALSWLRAKGMSHQKQSLGSVKCIT